MRDKESEVLRIYDGVYTQLRVSHSEQSRGIFAFNAEILHFVSLNSE